ncbi:deoxyribodipyrimidine photo-lyase [Staphylococcus simulans]|uniref:deoxyribodipyrimidine photo-lyase n=1 Tax=Staphylococcus simulans TaxID=1286 RepID=UPI000B107F77|nr:deoxyribodipyrimidine photo-lyase [Staphylococcus simulans]
MKSETRGRSLTQLEQELQRRGVKVFVIDASPTRITAIVAREDYLNNRRKWDEN